MVGLSLLRNESGPEILPTLWSDNYVNLLPGESKTVYADINNEDYRVDAVVECKGFKTYKTMLTRVVVF
jgi:hypothetical protein